MLCRVHLTTWCRLISETNANLSRARRTIHGVTGDQHCRRATEFYLELHPLIVDTAKLQLMTIRNTERSLDSGAGPFRNYQAIISIILVKKELLLSRRRSLWDCCVVSGGHIW